MNYFFHLLTYFGIFGVLALSLNILVGACGLMTMAHAAFFAGGAYTYALATFAYGFTPVAGFGLAILFGMLCSLLISLPTWKLKGDYFVVASIAVQVLIYSMLYNWMDSDAPVGTMQNLTNGPFGISGIPRPTVFGFTFDNMYWIAVFSLVILAFFAWATHTLLKSPWGRVLNCMRDDELSARNLGKTVQFYKVEAVLIACTMASIAGAVYSSYVSYIDPSLATMDQSILLLSMVLVGGSGNMIGPLVGTAILLAIPECLRMVAIPDTVAAEARIMLYGLLLVLMVHVRPKGLFGSYKID